MLDLGSGRGTLLRMLVDRKGVRGTGIEIVEEKVYEAVTKGVTVYHGDFSEGLSYYPAQSFDYVILSQTLQEARETVRTIFEALRVGRYVVASFPNFGNWRARLQLLVTGKRPGDQVPSIPVVRHTEHTLAHHQGLPPLRAGAAHRHRPRVLRGREGPLELLAEPPLLLRGLHNGDLAVPR